MTGKLGDKVNEIATKFNATPDRLQGDAGLQGPVRRVDGRGDRRVPRRQSAADRPGVRGRHGDDDGRQGRDQAGLPADGRVGREVRPEGLSRRRLRLLLRHAGPPAVDAVQQLVAGALHQRRRVQEGRPRSRPSRRRPGPRSAQAAEKLKASGAACAFTTGWQSWVQLESFSAWHNVPFATHGERLRRARHAARVQRPGAGQAHRRRWATGRRRACSPMPAARTSRSPSSRAATAR